MNANKLIIGSRKSRLALIQAGFIKELLNKAHPDLEITIHPLLTKGDKLLDKSPSKIGDKGLFTKELEEALTAKTIDIAIHSLKDLPTELPEDLALGAYSPREAPEDVFVSTKHLSLSALPQKGLIGTSSLRRQSQILHLRPDLTVIDIRGNVETRLKKLESENLDAVILARAGLKRLGLEGHVREILPSTLFLPAPGQGILAVQYKRGRKKMRELLMKINDPVSQIMAEAERSFMGTLGGGCHIPVGALATLHNEKIHLEGYIGSVDGSVVLRRTLEGLKQKASQVGCRLAWMMLDEGADQLISALRS